MLDLRNKRVIVTGGGSMVGSHICNILESRGAYVDNVPHADCNLLNLDEAYQRFSLFQPDYCIHAAGWNGGIAWNKKYPAEIFWRTAQMGLNVLKTCERMEIEKTVSLLASCAYPNYEVIQEGTLWSDLPNHTVECHGFAKRILDAFSRQIHKQYKLNMVCTVLNNCYGPCFDDKTEVLTVDGLKNIKDIKIGDCIYTLNPKTHDVEIGIVVGVQNNITNEWYKFQSKTVDFKITPDHVLYIKRNNNKEFCKKQAKDFEHRIGKKYGQTNFAHHNPVIYNHEKYPEHISLEKYIDDQHIIDTSDRTVKDYIAPKTKKVPYIYKPKDWFEFLGWYISEGSLTGHKLTQISIHQYESVNKNYCKDIRTVLANMGLRFGQTKTKKHFYFTSRLITNYLKENIGCKHNNKRMPKEIFYDKFPIELRYVIFDALMKGDGNKDGRRYSTTSTQLKDDFVHLCFLLGKKISYRKENSTWRISIYLSATETTVKDYGINQHTLDQNDPTYCITTDINNIICAGRNGKLNWIGQCDSYDPHKTKVVGALIQKFVKAKKENSPTVTCWGTGQPKRDFVYVGDAAEGVVRVLESYNDTFMPINIGTGKDFTIRELAETISKVVDYKGRVIWDADKPDGQMRKLMRCDLMKSVLKYEPPTSLKEGITKTVEWYLENH